MLKKVLITGGTGLIGFKIIEKLLYKGYEVNCLTRSKKNSNHDFLKYFIWNPGEGTADEKAFDAINYVINLAGAGVADKRWTTSRKKEILNSRVDSIKTLHKYLNGKKVEVFVSASAIGYYGNTSNKKVGEDFKPGNDFLAEVCVKWEKVADEANAYSERIIKIRIGVVLDKNEGALPKLITPIKNFVGAPLGNGEQYVSWIHIEDLVNLFIYSVRNQLATGAYNGVAPNPVTNEKITKVIAKKLNRSLWLPNVPSFVLKVLLGEMADVVLNSCNTSSKKIESSGYSFSYTTIESAITELM